MENIYEHTLKQKHLIETLCFKINYELGEKNQDNINSSINYIFPDNVIQLYEDIDKEVNAISLELEKLEDDERVREKNLIKLIEENRAKEMKEKKQSKTNLFLSFDDIVNIISLFPDGIYGIINYFPITKILTVNKVNDKIIKYITDKKMEYHNKSTIVKKLINNGKLTVTANEDSYGFVFMYEKLDDEIIDLNKVYLLKNGNINLINYKDPDNEEATDSEDDKELNDNVITKIYNFTLNKIILKEIIYESNFESAESVSVREQHDIASNKEIPRQNKLREDLNRLESDKKKYESLYVQVNEYNNFITLNIKEDDIKNNLNNFTSIKTLIRKISNPSKKILDINDFFKYNFANKFKKIIISNRYDESEYDNIIVKHFDINIADIVDNLLDVYNLSSKFKQYMNIFIEILLRLYIDEYLGYQTYCLGINLNQFLDIQSVMAEPDSNSIALKRRHWINLLESGEFKRFVTSLLNIINSKTYTLEQTLKYLVSLEINSIITNSASVTA
jgi:hypothetical protein